MSLCRLFFRSSLFGVAATSYRAPECYRFDPSDPVQTIGGPLCCGALRTGIGPQDQRPAEARSDVFIYTTPAFSMATKVTGPITLDLHVSSSAVDTDFTGMLVDVWPDGFAQNLTSGIPRLRYRNSQVNPELGKPGAIYHITLDLLATSNVFLTGHEFRLEVSSSNFPRFDRNMNATPLRHSVAPPSDSRLVARRYNHGYTQKHENGNLDPG
jgi:putative CocE/NonD family hydrolase